MTFDLRAHGTRAALLAADETLTYADLATRVDELLQALGPERRLILLRGRTSIDFVVTLIAALVGSHPVMVAAPLRPGHRDELLDTYDPDIVIDTDAGVTDVRREHSAHELHPELALLMSTSGSTGSPKLARLTYAGLRSNAAAITTYLDLTPADRGMLTLPLHYCYGLSILTSHLYAGAATVVTDWSVLDTCLWDLADEHRVTGLAGVPHTFEQFDQLGFPELESLRYVTSAGGKLAAPDVTRLVDLGQTRGWDFFVMYGQTEATARMAYLTPELAERHPQAIGVAIPGGRIRIDDADASGVGELCYAGPNVMMGYATSPADLARGSDVAELRTGDLAREIEPGVFEVVGRRSRFAKVFGLRLDLDAIERRLPFSAVCVDVDGRFGVVSADPDAAAAVAELCDIPAWAVQSVRADVPRTVSGKPDHAAARALVAATEPPASACADDVRALYERLLGRPVAPTDSFVSLGADSLSYVELSVRLGELINPLPRDWHRRTVAELQEHSVPAMANGSRRHGWASVDPTVLLRAAAITFIVGTHANLLHLMGGAHALLAVCGFNAARFLSTRSPSRSLLRTAWRVALPSSLWIGTLALFGLYQPATAVFLNGALGSDHWTIEWQFWFLEAAIWTLVGLAAYLAIPPLRRLDAAHPFASALVLLGATAALRYVLVGVGTSDVLPERYSLPVVAWFFVLGWAAARATTHLQRLAVLAAAAGLLYGFFGDPERGLVIAAAIAVLLWAKPVRLPRWVARPISAVAAASLAIYLTHWQVYPHLEDHYPLAATVSSIVVGLLFHRLCVVVGRAVRAVTRRMPVDVDRGVERGTDQHRDRQHVQQQQHRDGRREWTVDGRPRTAQTERPAHEVTAENPHGDREGRTRDARAPRLTLGNGHVVERRHEPDREHEHGRPVGTA